MKIKNKLKIKKKKFKKYENLNYYVTENLNWKIISKSF